jgi:hypothetical protein
MGSIAYDCRCSRDLATIKASDALKVFTARQREPDISEKFTLDLLSF